MERIRGNHEIGAQIRKRRQELGMSQQELAEKLKVSRQQVQRYESGKDTLNVERLQVLNRILSVSIEYFFRSPEGLSSRELGGEEELLVHFNNIPTKEQKKLVVVFARSLAS